MIDTVLSAQADLGNMFIVWLAKFTTVMNSSQLIVLMVDIGTFLSALMLAILIILPFVSGYSADRLPGSHHIGNPNSLTMNAMSVVRGGPGVRMASIRRHRQRRYQEQHGSGNIKRTIASQDIHDNKRNKIDFGSFGWANHHRNRTSKSLNNSGNYQRLPSENPAKSAPDNHLTEKTSLPRDGGADEDNMNSK